MKRIAFVTLGQKFSRLTIIKEVGRKVECLCDCGAKVIAGTYDVFRGHTKSCKTCAYALRSLSDMTHGCSTRSATTPEYRTWSGMKKRCNNPNDKNFKHYGGRGIKVCELWEKSFPSFCADMGTRPSSKHSIDRINRDGNYEPSNCRWATHTEQMNNTSRNHLLTHAGKTLSIAAWAREIGLSPRAISFRIRIGWSTEKVLTFPRRYKLKTAT